MYAFEYHRPTSLRQAASLLSKSEDAKIIAGGHTLLPTMKQRLAAPGSLIDLAEIPELKGIERAARSVTIGAMTRHADVAGSAAVQEAIPALAEMAELIGDPHVRHRGTIGAPSPTTIRPQTTRRPASHSARRSSLTSARFRLTSSSPGSSPPRSRKGRSSRRSFSRFRRRRPMPSSATRLPAMPSSAYSWPSVQGTSGLP
jgi:hypothetical protein